MEARFAPDLALAARRAELLTRKDQPDWNQTDNPTMYAKAAQERDAASELAAKAASEIAHQCQQGMERLTKLASQ